MDSLKANQSNDLKYIDNQFDLKTKLDKAFPGKIIFQSECYIKNPKKFNNINQISKSTECYENKKSNEIEDFRTCGYYRNGYNKYYNYHKKGGTGRPKWWRNYHESGDNKKDWRDDNNCQWWKNEIIKFKKEIQRIKNLYYELLKKHKILKKRYDLILKKISIELNFKIKSKKNISEKIYDDNDKLESDFDDINIEKFNTCGYYRKGYNKYYNYYRDGGTGKPDFAPKQPLPPCYNFRVEYNRLQKLLLYWKKIYNELTTKHNILKKRYMVINNKINLEENYKKNKMALLKKNIYDDSNQMIYNYDRPESFSNYYDENSLTAMFNYNKDLTEKSKVLKDNIELIKEKETNLQKINAQLKTSNNRNAFKKKIIQTLIALIFLLFILSLSSYIYFVRDYKINKN